jgi:hypothetical protein
MSGSVKLLLIAGFIILLIIIISRARRAKRSFKNNTFEDTSKKDFQNKQPRKITSTITSNICTKCHGSGKIKCPRCHGFGGWADHSSSSRRWIPCMCRNGKIVCPRCGGK